MPEYKVYVLRNDGRVISRINLFCDGVKRAKEWAKALEALGRLDPNRALRSDELRVAPGTVGNVLTDSQISAPPAKMLAHVPMAPPLHRQGLGLKQ